MFQTKEQDKITEELSDMEIGNLPEKECRLIIVLGFYFVPLSGIYSFPISFCLNFYLYVYVCSSLVTFLEPWRSGPL